MLILAFQIHLLALRSTSLLFVDLESRAKERLLPATFAHLSHRLMTTVCNNPLSNDEPAAATTTFLCTLSPASGDKAFRSLDAFAREFGRTPQLKHNQLLPATSTTPFGSESMATGQTTERVFSVATAPTAPQATHSLPVLPEVSSPALYLLPSRFQILTLVACVLDCSLSRLDRTAGYRYRGGTVRVPRPVVAACESLLHQHMYLS